MLEEVGTISRLENGVDNKEKQTVLEGEAAHAAAMLLVKNGTIGRGK